MYKMLDASVSFQDTSGICPVIGHRKKINFLLPKETQLFQKITSPSNVCI